MSDDPLSRVFQRFTRALSRKDDLDSISDSLLSAFTGEDKADKDSITTALLNLLSNGKLSLPEGAFQESFLDNASSAIDLFLTAAGRPDLAGAAKLSASAIKFINKRLKVDPCGGNSKANPPSGPPIGQQNGRHVIQYWVEHDGEVPRLPKIKGPDSTRDSRWARQQLKPAFELWEGELKLDVVMADKRENANLIITGRRFGAEVAPFGGDSVLALTDVGPPNGRQLAMVFDLAEDDLSLPEFRITAAHEFGHALGVQHSHVDKAGDLMSKTLGQLSPFPTDDDLRAAITHGGWVRS